MGPRLGAQGPPPRRSRTRGWETSAARLGARGAAIAAVGRRAESRAVARTGRAALQPRATDAILASGGRGLGGARGPEAREWVGSREGWDGDGATRAAEALWANASWQSSRRTRSRRPLEFDRGPAHCPMRRQSACTGAATGFHCAPAPGPNLCRAPRAHHSVHNAQCRCGAHPRPCSKRGATPGEWPPPRPSSKGVGSKFWFAQAFNREAVL